MTDRKMTVLRLAIFCVLAFVPFWIILPMMNEAYGEPVYMSEAAAPAVYALGTFGMLIPSMAHLITRLVTKEGFSDTYLGVHFKDSGKWYLASVWVKLAESVIGALLIWQICAGEEKWNLLECVDYSLNRRCDSLSLHRCKFSLL